MFGRILLILSLLVSLGAFAREKEPGEEGSCDAYFQKLGAEARSFSGLSSTQLEAILAPVAQAAPSGRYSYVREFVAGHADWPASTKAAIFADLLYLISRSAPANTPWDFARYLTFEGHFVFEAVDRLSVAGVPTVIDDTAARAVPYVNVVVIRAEDGVMFKGYRLRGPPRGRWSPEFSDMERLPRFPVNTAPSN